MHKQVYTFMLGIFFLIAIVHAAPFRSNNYHDLRYEESAKARRMSGNQQMHVYFDDQLKSDDLFRS